MNLFEMMNGLAKEAKPSLRFSGWEKEWRSTHDHGKPHCRARLQETGQYCQNAKFPGMNYCRTHMDEKWHHCAAMTTRGKRCTNRPFMGFLCKYHWKQKCVTRVDDIRMNLRAIGDVNQLRG